MQTPSQQAHPFELAGMGVGPYAFGGLYEMPTPGDGSAAMFGNANPYAEIQSLKLKAGAGTCACCGTGITIICVVVNGAGERYGVGSDCVEKLAESALCNAAKVEVAKRRNRIRRERADARREQQRLVWLTKPSTRRGALTGETNQQHSDREDRERKAKEDEINTRLSNRAASLKDILTALEATGNEFYRSLASQLRHGPLSDRQVRYVVKAARGCANVEERCTAPQQ